MDVKQMAPFVDALANIMPQLGFQEVRRGALRLAEDKLTSKGVMVVIGLTEMLRGNIVYNFTTDTARAIASTMMMGMPVPELDDMAQSAISELGNMLAANAGILLEGQGVSMNISPPTLIVGEAVQARMGASQRLVVEMMVDNNLEEVDIAVETA